MAQDQIELVRAQLPQGYDIAKYRANQMRGLMNDSLLADAASQNFLISDFDQNGIQDIVVIVEEHPILKDKVTKAPCEAYDPAKFCDFVYGKRALQFYKGQADGKFTLEFSNENAVLPAHDNADTLVGISLTAPGTVALNFSGGTAWTWEDTYLFQYKEDGFYQDEEIIKSCFVAREQCVVERTDLINQVLIQESVVRSNVVRRTRAKLEVSLPRTALNQFEFTED